MDKAIANILCENDRRIAIKYAKFDPYTGEGSLGERVELSIPDAIIPVQYIPVQMASEPFIKKLKRYKTIDKFIKSEMPMVEDAQDIVDKIMLKMRSKYDFPFWAYVFVRIKNKLGGDDIPFKLNRPQRILVDVIESQRKANKPIRVILLKARQFGGSTAIQVYLAWIQLMHKTSWNSTIASHTNTVSATVRGMYSKLMDSYPTWMLHPIGEEYNDKEPKITSFEGQQSIQYVPSRKCKIRIATANAQENLRSEDASMVHATEVALWPDTNLLHPEDFVDACMSGILRAPYTVKILESTAKGSGNYFHREYMDAKAGIGEYTPVFIPWKEVENDSIEFASDEHKEQFAKWLYDNRHQQEPPDRRSESGQYLWAQWQDGATLEGLHWYVEERKSKTSHEHFASEAPSNDIEAFAATGNEIFDAERVEELRATCKPPRWIGEIQGRGQKGKDAVTDVKFIEDKQGQLYVWAKPEIFDDEKCKNRYLVVVDIGGTSSGADYSVIAVLDRYWMMDGGHPTIVAQWYGHIDHDILAWKAAQIAKLYDDALLVIESNSLDKERDIHADVSFFILNRVKEVYDNLYERERSEEDIKSNKPVKYGFHTNRETKPKIIKNLQECVRDKLYVERDERCIEEYKTYEQNGRVFEAKQGYHDDLLMTRAIGLYVSGEMDNPVFVRTKMTTPLTEMNSVASLM